MTVLYPVTVTVQAQRALLGDTGRSTADSGGLFRNPSGQPVAFFGVRYILHKYARELRHPASTHLLQA